MHFEPWVVVVIIGILCVIFSWFVKEPEASHPAAADIEHALDLVTANLEEENRRLLEAMSAMKQEYALRAEAWEGKAVILENRVQDLSRQVQQTALPDKPDRSASWTEAGQATELAHALNQLPPDLEQPNEPAAQQGGSSGSSDGNSGEPSSIRRRYPELFQLDAEGKSVEQIARRIGLSKGETALILRLAKQEEQGHA